MPRAIDDRRDRKFLKLRRCGQSCLAIARRYNVALQTVYNGLERARLAERPAGTPPRPPGLVLACGSSCRALRILRCQDVHPCRACDTAGCVRCNWTGIAPIPKGSHICCAVCHLTGVESHPGLRMHANERPPSRSVVRPVPKPTRKERRKTKSLVERIEPSKN